MKKLPCGKKTQPCTKPHKVRRRIAIIVSVIAIIAIVATGGFIAQSPKYRLLQRGAEIREKEGGIWIRYRIGKTEISGDDLSVLKDDLSVLKDDLGIGGRPLFLDMTRKDIRKGALSQLNDLENLRGLYLLLTNVDDEEINHLTNANLVSLSISATGVTDRGLPAIGKLGSLASLDLSYTSVSNGTAVPFLTTWRAARAPQAPLLVENGLLVIDSPQSG